MKKIAFIGFLFLASTSLTLTSCKKETQKKSVLKELYKLYENGEISECKLDGKTVYTGILNAYDAPLYIYDEKGNEIGVCNYAWGTPDAICAELSGCDVVYRVSNNIWGRPAVDKYDLN